MTMRVKKTGYKNVYKKRSSWLTRGKEGEEFIYEYKIIVNGREIRSCSKAFKTERDCALALDKKLIELGHQPINILVKKE